MTRQPKSDILILVEDPGAANFVIDLPTALSRRGLGVHLMSGGVATAYLAQYGVATGRLPPCAGLDDLIAKVSPRLVAIGTAEDPDCAGLQLAALARERGIPTIGLVDASTNLTHRFRGRTDNPLEFCPDTVIVPDERARAGLLALGLRHERIFISGHPHWDYVRSAGRRMRDERRDAVRQRLFAESLANRRVVVFVAELSDGLVPSEFERSAEYSLTGTRSSRGRTEIVIEELLLALEPIRSEVYLILRLHPKNEATDFPAHRALFDTVSRDEPAFDLLYAADAVVGMTSMMLIEAALLDRPTLAILPRAVESEWLPTTVAGVTPYAVTRVDVADKIVELMVEKPKVNQTLLQDLFPLGAMDRVADVFETLVLPGQL
jgi:hypothetical protein